MLNITSPDLSFVVSVSYFEMLSWLRRTVTYFLMQSTLREEISFKAPIVIDN